MMCGSGWAPYQELYLIHVRFDAIRDSRLRDRIETIPTDLQITEENAEVIIQAAHQLLENSREYQRLLKDLKKS